MCKKSENKRLPELPSSETKVCYRFLCILPLIFNANTNVWVHTYAYICFVIRNVICYRLFSLLFFFPRNALEGPSLSVHNFFFFNNGIIFHPKEASCFIYPSATAGRLGLPPILELHAEHQSHLRFTISGHTLPLSRI